MRYAKLYCGFCKEWIYGVDEDREGLLKLHAKDRHPGLYANYGREEEMYGRLERA